MNHVSRIHRGQPESLSTLLYRMTGLSHEEVALLIRMGGAYHGNRRCKDPDQQIDEGALVEAYWRLPLVMEEVSFKKEWVRHKDRQILIAAKPAGIPTQGRRDADYLAFYELLKTKIKGYLGLHHRLDQDTSGLMLFCRDPKTNADMARVFSEHLIRKGYLAYCAGVWPSDQDQLVVDAPIGAKREQDGTRQEIDPKGKAAVTEFVRLAEADGRLLVACWPKTGRTHQIRVHLSHIGLPLVGDALYDGAPDPGGFLLHCAFLAWPKTGNLPAGSFRLGPPPAWTERVPRSFVDAYHLWKETVSC